MYRIISGKWKGRKISAPKNYDVRPTTDFAKEGLFNILGTTYDFHSIKVLDLFAGIGSISLEFCSRGVPSVTAVEMNRKHADFIKKTSLKLGGEDQLQVNQSEVFQFLQNTNLQTDIVFADPPFSWELKDYQSLHQSIFDKGIILPYGLLIIEHSQRISLSEFPNFETVRNYGNIGFSFFNV